MSGFTPIKPDPVPVPKPAPPVDMTPPTAAQIDDARRVLQTLLRQLRWDRSGGYPGYVNGRWSGTRSLPAASPVQLDALFRFAGVTPDAIESRGDCADCANAKDGRERGYDQPCVRCLRPYHDQFVPIAAVAPAKKAKAKR